MIQYVQAMGSKVGGVELLAHDRAKGTASNDDLLLWHAHLKGHGWKYPKRDFVTSSKSDLNEIATEAVKSLDQEMQKYIDRMRRYERLKARSVGGHYTTRTGKVKELKKPPDVAQVANQWGAKMLRAGMKIYMEQVHDRMERGVSNAGSVPPLNKKTVDRKGHDEFMKETAQLLDNLDFGGLGGKNIRVTR